MDHSTDPASRATYRARPAAISDPTRLTPRLRRRRALSLVVMTLLVPGSAQLVAGNRGVGRVALRVWLSTIGVLAVLGLVALVRRSWVIGLLSRGAVLAIVAAVLAVLALGWLILFVDTLRLAQLRLVQPATRRAAVALTAVGMLLTSGTLVVASRNVSAARDVLNSVFGGSPAAEASAGRYNILLLGGDSGADRYSTRPDSITVVSVDADTGKPVMFGFARDTENIHFRPGSVMAGLMPNGWACGDNCLLNALYVWGTEHAKDFPAGTADPGMTATVEAVEALSGLDIQYYVLIDLKGFQALINAVGGLEIDVKQRTIIGQSTDKPRRYIEPGRQVLNGYYALWYARSREGASNYDRMARQRCVMQAMLKQLSPTTVITKFQDIAAASSQVVKTNIPQSELGTMADLALKAKGQKITSVNFVPPLVNPWSYDPKVILDKVAATIEASTAAPANPAPAASTKPTGKGSTPTAASTPPPQTDDVAAVCSL
ncbi:MAG: LCP family protein [Candidatus Lutibacillus vidarii]